MIMLGEIPIERNADTECWVGLVLSSWVAPMKGSQVTWTKKRVLAPHLVAKLAQGFHKGLRLDVADRAADFKDDHLRPGLFANQPDTAFDFVGDMRDDLDRAAQVIAVAFLADDLGIYLPGGEVAETAQADVHETFVVAQIQVCFGAIIEDVHFAMLVRRHCARDPH